MNKELIRKRFRKNLKTYNKNAIIQNKMAYKLLSFSESNNYKSILEIGCGTGLLTEKINNRFKYNNYIANDIVDECESYIKNINPKINFINKDIEEYVDSLSTKFDLIIANASLQWLENLEEFISKLHEYLEDNGIMLFSIFGKENLREVSYITEKSLNYYTAEQISEMLKQYSPIIEEEVHIMAFKNPKEVLNHIKFTGVNAISSESWTKKDLTNFEKGYNNLCSGRPTLTYHPIYIKIVK